MAASRPTNLTIKVDPQFLLWARLRALQYGTSVNAVLAECREELARRPRPFPEPPGAMPVPPLPPRRTSCHERPLR